MTLAPLDPPVVPVERHLHLGSLFETSSGRIVELIGEQDGLRGIGRAEYREWFTGITGIIPVDTMKDCGWKSVAYVRLALDVRRQFPEATEDDLDALFGLWTLQVGELGFYRYGRLDVSTFREEAGDFTEFGPSAVLTAIYQSSLDDILGLLRLADVAAAYGLSDGFIAAVREG